jgi:hypothetical protein
MSMMRLSKVVFWGLLLAGVSVGVIWATSGSGTQPVLIGRATFQPTKGNVLQVERVQPPDWGVALVAGPALDVAVQTITFQPGGNSGWHSHPGPVFISVIADEMTSTSPTTRTASRSSATRARDTSMSASMLTSLAMNRGRWLPTS